MTTYRKKLIEVALPLDAINRESAHEKSVPRKGHPATLHLWWARRPLAACRAVLFSQMVDDPSSLPEEFPTEEAQAAERQRLFRIIEELVKWENTTNEAVLHAARTEIAHSAARNHGVSLPQRMTPAEVADALKRYAPPMLDPFAGGGSIPLEAQRLGLEAHASDLNPVAVLINKALIEIPPKFAGRPPVNPESREKYLTREWRGAQGLAEDVRYYGKWMRDEAWKRIGHLYPKVQLPTSLGGGAATVIVWLWARAVKCPNPACGAQMPLVRSFALSTKEGKQAWVEPVVDREAQPPNITFEVKLGSGGQTTLAPISTGTGLINERGKKVKATFLCVACRSGLASGEYIDSEANAGRMGVTPLAVVAESKSGRVYLPFDQPQVTASEVAREKLEQSDLQGRLPTEPARGTFASNAQGRIYGFKTFKDYFTSRQLVALTTLSALASEVREHVIADTEGDAAYADAVTTYLAFSLSKLADWSSTGCSWIPVIQGIRDTFARQAIPMIWDFAEVNVLSNSVGNVLNHVEWVADCLESIPSACCRGVAKQHDAATSIDGGSHPVISTDPPYYDNISYADLSDFFYVWLRRSLGAIYPDLFGTLLVPKTAELVATPYRFGGSAAKARHFFEAGLGKAFALMQEAESPIYPLTVYYAFKQAESDADDAGNGNGVVASASTGWETMLEGLLQAGFSIGGTWPMRSERGGRTNSIETNALASSIVLVCRPRPADAPLTTRRDFLSALKRELPGALKHLQHGNIAPVDLAQASIGPGMAVFSRYSKVLESDGTPMRVRTALQLINQTLDEVLAEQEGEYDADTRWAVAWFEQFGMEAGAYGVAETLSKAKDTAVGALVEAGILEARSGKVRLLRRDELSQPWNPRADRRPSVWKATQYLIRALQEQGDEGAAAILDAVGGLGETARDLAYRLYTTCERKKWADEALAYNSLVVEWPEVAGGVERLAKTTARQARIWQE